MRIGYRAGFEDGYAQALSDCKEQLERATVNGVFLGYRAVYERLTSDPPPQTSRLDWFMSGLKELEGAIEAG